MDSIKWIFLRVVCYPYGVPDLVQRWDYVELPRPRKDANGYLVAPQTRIARTGPQTYQNADGSTHVELRLPEDVGDREALSSLSGLPVTIGHPGQVTPSNVQSHAVGSTGRADLRGDLVEADVSIWAERGQRAAEDGARELSVGYQVALEPVPGGVFRRSGHPYDGTRADYLQRGIRGNHLALVNRGRANQGRPDRPVGLRLDADGNQEQPGVEAQEQSMEKITINGQTFEVTPEVAKAIRADAHSKAEQQRTQVRADADDSKLAALEAQIAKSEARADAAEAALKAEQDKAKSEETLAAKRKADAERIALVVEVAKITDSDAKALAELDADALRAKAIEKLSPSLSLDGKSADYKQALYDHLTSQRSEQSGAPAPRKTDSATEIQQALAGGAPRETKADESPLAAATKEAHGNFFFSGQKAGAQ